jgi:nucleotide-binding universal stress UspA family protein
MVRIQRILCPVDFFPASLRAVDYAIGLAQKYDAKLHLLHVVSPILYSTEQYAFTVSDIIDSMKKQSARKMKKLERKARAAGLTIYTDVRTGEVKREIESAVRATKADILVMGTHGRRGMEKWFLGSVTERMLRRSPIPVLTLRGSKKARTTTTRILVTTDFSEGTDNALNYALSIARANKARLTLLHVLEETRAVISPQYRKEITEGVRRELLQRIPADAQGSPDIDTAVEAGTPYHIILRLLKKERIDLLVMNTHGKGMLHRALLGSTSERIARAADCPVMLIPPMKKAKSNRRARRRAA